MANNNRGTKDSFSLDDGEEQRQEYLWIFGFASITNAMNINIQFCAHFSHSTVFQVTNIMHSIPSLCMTKYSRVVTLTGWKLNFADTFSR